MGLEGRTQGGRFLDLGGREDWGNVCVKSRKLNGHEYGGM